MAFFRKIQRYIFGSGRSLHPEIFEAIPLPVLLLKPVDDHFYIVNATDAYCELTGTVRKKLAGKTVLEAFPDEEEKSWKRVKASFTRVIQTGESDSMDILRYDLFDPETGERNERYWQVQNIPLRDAIGNIAYIWNAVIDKTSEVLIERERRDIEKEKVRRREENKVFIRESTDGLFSLDRSGKFLSVNEGLVQIAETPEEELLRMNFLPFCAEHDREKILDYFKKAVEGVPQKFEADYVSARGRQMVLIIDLLPMKLEGEIKGVYGKAKDITSLRSSEKTLDQKKMYLGLYSKMINFLVSFGMETVNLEYIFGQLGETVQVDRIFYLGKSLEDLDNRTLIADNFQWSRKNQDSSSWKPNLYWYQRLVEVFGPFQYDTPVILKSTDQTLQKIELLGHLEGGNLLVLPMFVKEQFTGIVGVEHQHKPRLWEQEELEFMTSLLKNVVSFAENKLAELEVEKKDRELEKTREKFELLVQEGSDLIGILEADGTYKFVSASSERILGIDPRDFVGRNAFDFIHPDDKDIVFAQFSSIALQRQVHIPPFRFKDADGNWRWVETTATNLLTVPRVEGIVTNSKEVTREVERSNEIKELNERYRLAASATRDLIYDWDLKTNEVVRYFEGKEKIFGFSLEKMTERDFWKEHIHPDDIVEVTKHLEEILTNPNAQEINTQYRFRKSDGSYAYIVDRARIVRDESGKAMRLIGATSDISEITSSRNALKLANIRLNYAMKATREMVWDWDIEEDTILRSKAFKKIYGYDDVQKPSVENFWFNKIVPKEREKVKSSLYEALRNPRINKWKKEYSFIKEGGSKSHVVDRGYIVRNSSGKAIRMVGATLDVTESRRMLKEIKRQNKVLKEIAWEQAHVVRGPLTRLKGLVELIKQEIFDDWNREELIDLISKSADELDDIVINIIRKTEELDKKD